MEGSPRKAGKNGIIGKTLNGRSSKTVGLSSSGNLCLKITDSSSAMGISPRTTALPFRQTQVNSFRKSLADLDRRRLVVVSRKRDLPYWQDSRMRLRKLRSPVSSWTGRNPLLPEVSVRETRLPPLWQPRSPVGAFEAGQSGVLYSVDTEVQPWAEKTSDGEAAVEEAEGKTSVPTHYGHQDCFDISF